MDHAIDERGKNKSKRELCWFYSKDTAINSVCATKQNVRTLIIIGQPNASSFSAISELTLLQELWIVECGIKDVPSLRKCTQLERLYLYSNEIERIPYLSGCSRLKILSLSGNSIRGLKNLRTVTWIEELNLANNKLKRVGKIFSRKSAIHCVNFSGNNLYCMKDIKHLAILRKLNSAVFVDPLYGKCPLVNYCNYRFYVINTLPYIERLDHYSISDKERQHAHTFHKEQLMFYNMQLHKQVNVYLKSVRNEEYQHQKRISYLNEQLRENKAKQGSQSNSKYEDSSAVKNIMLQIDTSNKKFEEWKETAAVKLKIQQEKLLLSMSYYGNISFIDYRAENAVAQLSRKILEESLCPVIKSNTNVTGVKVHGVTKVINKEMSAAYDWQNEEWNLQTDTVLKILESPLGVTRHQSWPFAIFETEPFAKKEIIVSDCLASADSEWLGKLIISDENIDLLHSTTVPEKRCICVLIQTLCTDNILRTTGKKVYIADRYHSKYMKYHSGSSTRCHKVRLSPKDIRNPIFVVEYEYISKNINLAMDKKQEHTVVVELPTVLQDCLSSTSINSFLGMEECEVNNLAKICITDQNLNAIDARLDLPNLREFDISHNRLTTFPDLPFIKNVKILNVSFNCIQSVCTADCLPMLEDLNISWNCLKQCLNTCQIIRTCMPSLKGLNLSNNPFEDAADRKEITSLLQLHLPKLQLIDNEPYKKHSSLDTSHFPCALSRCKQNRQHEIQSNMQSVGNDNIDPELLTIDKTIQKKKCIHLTNNLQLSQNIFKSALTIKELCVTHCSLTTLPVTKPLKHLTKLNLSSNLITTLEGFTKENLPALNYLDLSNNLISSLQKMGESLALQEFYCSHNKLCTLADIENIISWNMLQIIDLCNNPIDKDELYRKFIVFHLPKVQYISAVQVTDLDVSEAGYLFSRTLNKYILSSMYAEDHLTNITQLSIVNCSLTKVDLVSDALPHLQSLDLSQNKITCIFGLHSFLQLHTLCLSYNCLEAFEESNIENKGDGFSKLCTLFLDHNCIKTLMGIRTERLPAIKHVFLNHNNIQSIDGINECLTLETLILDYNKIDIPKEHDVRKNNNIKILSLENNKMCSLQFIKSLPKVEKLYIANNNLTNKDELRHLTLTEDLKEITLEGNIFRAEQDDVLSIIQNFELTSNGTLRNRRTE